MLLSIRGIKMKKTIKLLILIVLTATVVISVLTSCSSKNDPETVAAAEELIEKSYEINEIFFGKGLAVDEESRKEALENLEAESDVLNVAYARADALCGYDSISSLKEDALSVYSEEYCEILFASAFNGIKDAIGNTVEYARYIEDEYGFLTVRLGLEDNAIELDRTYDLSSIKIIKQSDSFALFTVDSLVAGTPSDTVRIKMVMTENGWRLDTPTY